MSGVFQGTASIYGPSTGGTPPPPGSGTTNVLVYRPGGVTSGNVYATWAALYTAYTALDTGPLLIEIDSSLTSPAVIPAGAYVLRGDTIIRGASSSATSGSSLQIADGATFNHIPRFENNLFVHSVSTGHVVTLDDGLSHTITITDHSFLSSQTAPFFRIENGLTSLTVVLGNFSVLLDSASELFSLEDPGAGDPTAITFLLIGASPVVQDDVLLTDASANADYTVVNYSDTGSFDLDQPGWDGNTPTFSQPPRTMFKPTAVKTSNYTAAPGELVVCDASGGAFTVTLPDALLTMPGECIAVYNGAPSANAVSISAPSGFAGVTSLVGALQTVVFCFDPATTLWIPIAVPSAEAYGTLIFRPGGTTAGNVFNDFAVLYAFYLTHPSVTCIEFDDTDGTPCVMPAATYVWRFDLTLRGFLINAPIGLGSSVSLASGTLFNRMPRLSNLGVVSFSNAGVLVTSALASDLYIYLDEGSWLRADGPKPFITHDDSSYTVYITLMRNSRFATGTAAVLLIDDDGNPIQTNISLGLSTICQIEDDTIDSSAGTCVTDIELSSGSGHISYIQTGYLSVVPFGDITTFFYRGQAMGSPSDDVRTSDVNAIAGETVRCDPTGGSFTVTLPDNSTVSRPRNPGSRVTVKNQSASPNTIYVDPAGTDTIDGVAAPMAFSIVGARTSFTFEWDGVSDWMLV